MKGKKRAAGDPGRSGGKNKAPRLDRPKSPEGLPPGKEAGRGQARSRSRTPLKRKPPPEPAKDDSSSYDSSYETTQSEAQEKEPAKPEEDQEPQAPRTRSLRPGLRVTGHFRSRSYSAPTSTGPRTSCPSCGRTNQPAEVESTHRPSYVTFVVQPPCVA